MFDIWNQYEALAIEQYNKDNYKVIDYASSGDDNVKRKYCVIYCSSNDIWYPNELSAFKHSFFENDYYEWTSIECQIAVKEIYVRDIYKSWYVTGINSRINSIEKLIEFLKDEIGELPIICVGSSSGGYLAVLLACLLHASHALCFSAQFNLDNKHAMGENPFLQRYQLEYLKSKYYDLIPIIEESTVPVFYICPIGVDNDKEQCSSVENMSNVKIVRFRSKHHGVVLYKTALSELVSKNEEELNEWYLAHCKKCCFPFLVSLELAGFQCTIRDFYRRGLKYLKRKIEVYRWK